MTKTSIVIILLSLFALNSYSQDKINWVKWNEGYEQAKKENKLILVDIVSNNCKYCKKMDRITFVDKKVVRIINDKYVAIKINSDRGNDKFVIDNKEYTMAQMLAYLTNNSVLAGKPRIGYPTYSFIFIDDLTRLNETGYQDPAVFKYMLVNCSKKKSKRDKKKN